MLVVAHFSLEDSLTRDIFRSSVHCARSLIKPGNGQGLESLKWKVVGEMKYFLRDKKLDLSTLYWLQSYCTCVKLIRC